ncbi:hypothetical protein [Flavobacterium luteum]|uniref:Alpha-ketoglutarate decarboxylase n=1 Tax=Flavobacterium luteum TaxID=2026654 RepID=A0A7J5AGW0_9FLAO|nr:hypothetical protein [Flavobacterium luteum]KAB1156846.1 hypothetical protein F6464_05710 [Flavobacterium luteum]
MKKKYFSSISKPFLILILFIFSNDLLAQQQGKNTNLKSDFWKKVQFGGGVGLSIGNRFTDIALAPNAIYNFNKYVALGFGLQGGYVSNKNVFTSIHYGASLITLMNPIEEIQISVELEQIRVNNKYESITGDFKNNFWNTGLFLGGGYKSGNVTVGMRYNILHNSNNNVYNEAFMPFVRVFF